MICSPVNLLNLPLVLNDLQTSPFEPLSTVSLEFLTRKFFFLVGITSGRWLGENGALLSHHPYLSLFQDKAVL